MGIALRTISGCRWGPRSFCPSRQAVEEAKEAPSALWATIPSLFIRVYFRSVFHMSWIAFQVPSLRLLPDAQVLPFALDLLAIGTP
jgi:hypothetical protein